MLKVDSKHALIILACLIGLNLLTFVGFIAMIIVYCKARTKQENVEGIYSAILLAFFYFFYLFGVYFLLFLTCS